MTKQNKVFLVWPEQLDGRKHLTKFYLDYISCFAPDSNLNIILKDISIEGKVFEQIASRNQSINITIHHIPEVMDIWIRDWAPLPVQTDKGVILLKAEYRPAYIKEKDFSYCEGDNRAGRRLAEMLEIPLVDFPLIWDLGNFTHNGKGTGIVTRRILDDNLQYNEYEIKDLFKRYAGVTELIIVKEEPGDVTGHVDGTLMFIGPDHLLLAIYPDDHIKENIFLNEIELKIREEIKSELKITRILNGPVIDKYSEGVGSAMGNHVNYFSAGDDFYFPCYGIKEDLIAKERFKAILQNKNIIDVNTPEINRLADKGGVLHCMTWRL
jgi:agmatine/peptidylarginine deiminase